MRIAWCFLGLFFVASTVAAQKVLWEVEDDFGGRATAGSAVLLIGNAVIFTGRAELPGSVDPVPFMQSRHRTDGSVQWTVQAPEFLGGGAASFKLIASSQGRIFAATQTVEGIVVRAYEAATGTLLWSEVWDAGGNVDQVRSMVAGPGAVVVVGQRAYGEDIPGPDSQLIVRAYDPVGGAPLWEDRVRRYDHSSAVAVAVSRNRVFVLGSIEIHDGTEPSDMLLRAYNASSGRLIWETMRPATPQRDRGQCRSRVCRRRRTHAATWERLTSKAARCFGRRVYR